jgi:hypothetical protein
MNITRTSARAARLLAAAFLIASPAQAADVFDFIPLGGRTLLAKAFASRPPADEVKGLLAGKRTREEWLVYLREHSKAIAGLKSLSEKELLTLADYLRTPPRRIGRSCCRRTGATLRSIIARAAISSRS